MGRNESFSDKMMLGGQINSRIQFSYGFHGIISKLVKKFSKSEYLESIFLSINLSTLIWTIFSFFIIYFICQNVFGKSNFNLFYIFLFNPILITAAEESRQMSIMVLT